MFASVADDAAVLAGAAVTHGLYARWPLKDATERSHIKVTHDCYNGHYLQTKSHYVLKKVSSNTIRPGITEKLRQT